MQLNQYKNIVNFRWGIILLNIAIMYQFESTTPSYSSDK